jgi:DNA-binding Lrp family transcriptional regulator
MSKNRNIKLEKRGISTKNGLPNDNLLLHHPDYKVRKADDLDKKDFLIVKELIKDASLSSTAISNKYHMPLSTVQRRLQRLLESGPLTMKYSLDLGSIGWRIANLFISARNGNSEKIATLILEKFKRNIMSTSVEIGNPVGNVVAQAYFRTTEELHILLDNIKQLPEVKDVAFSELVKVVGSNESTMMDRFFDKHENR